LTDLVLDPRRPFRLPRLFYHLTEASNWPSIVEHGLLSCVGLIELTGASPEVAIRHRPKPIFLASGVILNDQAPLTPASLRRCLVDMTPEEWYSTLNERVFLWPSIDRAARQRAAAHRRRQVLITVNGETLIERYGELAEVSPINSGYARRRAARRGRDTFVPVADWADHSWARTSEPGRPAGPAEITVRNAVVDVTGLVESLRFLDPGVPV
jgi:uncharacterized protein DUF7002